MRILMVLGSLLILIVWQSLISVPGSTHSNSLVTHSLTYKAIGKLRTIIHKIYVRNLKYLICLL